MRRIKDYELLEILGEGGMGMVYRARHRETGQWAAIKTLRVPNAEWLQGIRREIRALKSLSHPGIVRVLDEGLHEGMPWYAMELLRGTALDQYWWRRDLSAQEQLSAAPTHILAGQQATSPGPFEPAAEAGVASAQAPWDAERAREALSLIVRLCEPLRYLHGQGFVHRDLKPANVIVQTDGRLVLIDLGITISTGTDRFREKLDNTLNIAGTLKYMAPEQIRGEFLDARADIYALGCILFELLTGRPPFVEEAWERLVWRQLETPPPRLEEFRQGAPPALEELVGRMLAKAPDERIGYAVDVQSALERLGAAPGSQPRRGDRLYLYRPRLEGRKKEFRALEQCLQQLRDGVGGLVLIGGESGMGKTRLAMEMAREAAKDGCRIYLGESLDFEAEQIVDPLWPLRPLLRQVADRCREKGAEEAQRLIGGRATILALYEPSLAGLANEAERLSTEGLPAKQARQWLFVSLIETLEALTQEEPALLVLDDLQHADELTLEFLAWAMASKRLENLQALILGMYRSEMKSDALERLLRQPGLRRVELERLDEGAVQGIVRGMLVLETPSEWFGRMLHQRSGGNPFFVAEYLMAALAQGLLWRDEEGHWQLTELQSEQELLLNALPLPQSLQGLLELRLRSLPAELLDMAQNAAILGSDFPSRWLEAMAVEGDPARKLDLLIRLRILEEREPGVLHFCHPHLREQVASDIAEAHRRKLERAAAEAIEGFHQGDQIAVFWRLAQHWSVAGEKEKATRRFLEGAALAKQRFAHAEAERFYRAALECAPPGSPESIQARIELAYGVLYVRGKYPDSRAELAQAAAEAKRAGDLKLECFALVHLGFLEEICGNPAEAERHYSFVLKQSSASGDHKTRILCLARYSRLHVHQGRISEAQKLLSLALLLERESPDPYLKSRILGFLLVIHLDLGLVQDALKFGVEAIQIARQHGLFLAQAGGHIDLSRMYRDLGLFQEAMSHLNFAKRIIDKIGNEQQRILIVFHSAEIHVLQENWATAKQFLDQSLALCREGGDRIMESLTLDLLGQVEMKIGNLGQAREFLRQALLIQQADGYKEQEAYTECQLARLERLHGEEGKGLEQAGGHLQAAETILRQLKLLRPLPYCLCEQGHWMLAQGRSARKPLDEARAIVEQFQCEPSSEFRRMLARLERAEAAFRSGKKSELRRGEHVSDWPRSTL